MSNGSDPGFSWRVRLGDVLTICIIVLAAISLMIQIANLAAGIYTQFGELRERMARAEAEITVMMHKDPK